MLIEIKVIATVGRHKQKRILRLKCNKCHIEFEKKYQFKYTLTKLHFCKKSCMDADATKGGELEIQKVTQSLITNGTSYASQTIKARALISKKISISSKTAKAKRQETCLTKYGTSSVFQNEDVKFKSKKTSIERYGVEFPSQAESIKEKIKSTCLERYGFKNPSQVDIVKNKKANTAFKNYGVKFTLSAYIVRQKIENTNIARYGVRSILSLPNFHEKSNSLDACIKRYETMRKNGSFRTSRPENMLFTHLCDKFGFSNVERWKNVNGWPIDFYVKSNNTYYQYDGEYWHGHDRPLETILQFKTLSDRAIYKKILIDAKQNKYFDMHNMKLIRVIGLEGLNRFINGY